MSQMPTPIPTKTIKRARNEGRIVVTCEVAIAPERMAQAPSYARDATDVLRELLPTLTFEALERYLEHQGVTVTSTDVRAAK